jgi:long-chain acyl-CoA synthetase
MERVTRLFDLLELYRHEFRSIPDAFNAKREGKWISFSAADYVEISNLISLGFLSMGVGRGTKVATIMVNSPEWNFFDFGIMQTGAIQVPIYPTISEENFRFILNDAQVEYLVISNAEIYRRIKSLLPGIPSLKKVFSVEPVRGVSHWSEITDAGRRHQPAADLNRTRDSILPGDMVTIIYTSGTTGLPKGVMLSHLNFISNFKACSHIREFGMRDRVLSFLPLCHVYERMLNYLFQSYGMSVFYADNLEQVSEYLREVRPHTFAAVPRVLEKIYNRVVSRGRDLPRLQKGIFFWALRQGHKFELDHKRGLIYDIKLLFANMLIFSKWRRLMGGEVKVIVSGGASLHPRLSRLFWAAGIPIIEGYGLTETSPVIAVSNLKPGGMRFGYVGPLLPGVEVRIDVDGEILVRGPGVMLGYYNKPEKTAQVIDPEGWFHTGDIGELDRGFLRITDRKKEIFKTSGGKIVSPQMIEQRMKESPFVEHIMVIGDNRPYAAALIIPNFDHLRKWCALKHIAFSSREKAVYNPRIIRRIRKEVEWLNQDFGQTERIKKFRLLADEWNMAGGELSPTLKLRRKFIQEKYHQIIEETYRSSEYNYRIEED